MSKYFGFVGDEVHDFEFRKHHFSNWKYFYLGDHLIAIVIKLEHKAGWGVIVHDVENHLETPVKVEGFVSRHAAVDYALMTNKKTRDLYHNARQEAKALGKLYKEKADV